MRGAVMQLARWGVLPRIVAAGTPPVRRTSFAYGPERIDIDIREGHGVDALYAPRRTVLDPALVAEARAAGAEFRFGTAVQAPAAERRRAGRGRGGGHRRPAPHRDPRRHRHRRRRAALDGRAPGRGAGAHVTGAHAAAAIYAYVAGLADRGNRWHYAPGLSAGAIPTNGGLHCIFASVPPERYPRRDPPRPRRGARARCWPRRTPRSPPRSRRAGIATRPVGFAGEPGYLRRSHGPGWALVGDAGYFKDPITAHGITDALRDAEILARAVEEGGTAALARYQEARDALSLPLFRTTDAIAALDWDLRAVQELHLELNRAMKAEQDWLAGAWPGVTRAA